VRPEECPVLVAILEGKEVCGGVGVAEPVALVIKLALQDNTVKAGSRVEVESVQPR
jgi:hypothetical protein